LAERYGFGPRRCAGASLGGSKNHVLDNGSYLCVKQPVCCELEDVGVVAVEEKG
jgi:hypothetical protein